MGYTKEMQCPIDNHSLHTKTVSGVEIDICPKCQGVWLQSGELEKLVLRFSVDQKNEFLKLSERDGLKTTPPADFWSETEHVCPKDGRVLGRLYYGGNSRIGIEHCSLCLGFWLDGGELESVRKIVAPNIRLDSAIAGYSVAYEEEASFGYDADTQKAVEYLTHPEFIAEDGMNLGYNLLINALLGVMFR